MSTADLQELTARLSLAANGVFLAMSMFTVLSASHELHTSDTISKLRTGLSAIQVSTYQKTRIQPSLSHTTTTPKALTESKVLTHLP